jgi:hypothetical protein
MVSESVIEDSVVPEPGRSENDAEPDTEPLGPEPAEK